MSTRIRTCLAVLLATTACTQQRPPDRLVIAVVGSGADTVRARGRFHFNRAQGAEMWRGAQLAYDSSPALTGLHDVIELRGYDDGGYEELADSFATVLQHDPAVLAVIGHATSGTTRVAVRHYSASGIPLLMPIATSPSAVRFGHHRARFAFRLPPSDDQFQAPAIALVVDALRSRRVFLVKDTSAGAESYSTPLFDAVDKLLAGRVVERGSVARATGGISSTTFSAVAQKPDVIVFCGYGTTAQEFFQALRREYAGVDPQRRPKVVLSDGSWIKDLDAHGFDAFITFPVPAVDASRSPEAARLLRQAASNTRQSYEVLGYDAMLLVAAAVQDCKREHRVSRACVRSFLASRRNLPGVQSTYSFQDGENLAASYNVYRSVAQDSTGDVTAFDSWRVFPASLLLNRLRHPPPGES